MTQSFDRTSQVGRYPSPRPLQGLALATALALSVGIAGAAVAAAPTAKSPTARGAAPRPFDGFNESFDLGESPENGAACFAEREFSGPLVDRGARVWRIRCRGYGQPWGAFYLLPPGAKDATTALDAVVKARASCPSAAAGGTSVTCKTREDARDWVVVAPDGKTRRVAAQGYASIGTLIAKGVAYMRGTGAPLAPAALAERTAVQAESSAPSEEEAVKSGGGLQLAYQRGAAWKFDDAQLTFRAVAGAAELPLQRLEAQYSLALEASNQGRFDEAADYFAIADAELDKAGPPGDAGRLELEGLALNDKAADARNRGDFKEAEKLAGQAIAKREAARAAGVVVQSVEAGLETPRQRQSLRDAEAYEIRASALMAERQPGAARADTDRALAILGQPLGAAAPSAKLADVDPLLAVEVHGDDLILSPSAAALKSYRLAVSVYGFHHPDDLPMGFFLIQLAQAEAAAGAQDKSLEERALADYEDAFRIFLAQRGSLAASADFVKTYFDILLARIGDQPAAHPTEVARFFSQSQILISQSSAKAALRQAERIKSGDAVEAGLAHQYDEGEQEIRRVQQEEDYDDASGRLTAAARASYADQLKTLRARQDALDGRLAAVDPGYKARLATTVTLPELQAVLAPGKELYLRAFVLGGGGYGMLVGHDSATPYRIDLDARRAGALVDAVRRPIDHPEVLANGQTSPHIFDVAAAHKAFDAVLGPVQAQVLSPTVQMLIFDPDATLVALPLPALVTDAKSVETMQANVAAAKASNRPVSYAGVDWLGSRVATSVSLSPAAFIALRAQKPSAAPRPFLGFGDPVLANGNPRAYASIRYRGPASATGEAKCQGDRKAVLEPLPASGKLVDELAARAGGDSTTVVGSAFTDTYVLKAGAEGGALGQYKVVFFATHGLLPSDVDQCSPPALVTSLDPAADSVALLDAPRIEGLRLQADLVVLAACNTGRNTDKGSGGEALGGLVESFVEAGAHNVLVSNWSVGSNATKTLIEHMFDHVRQGADQAEALALAEREVMTETGRQNPYWWAAFMIVGDGAKPLTL